MGFIVAAFPVGCESPSTTTFAQIVPGMSRADVVSVLGEPTSRFTVPADEVPMRGYAERFSYGDTFGSLTTQLVFRDLPDPRVWSVLFDSDGRVVETLEPLPEESLPPRRLETMP